MTIDLQLEDWHVFCLSVMAYFILGVITAKIAYKYTADKTFMPDQDDYGLCIFIIVFWPVAFTVLLMYFLGNLLKPILDFIMR